MLGFRRFSRVVTQGAGSQAGDDKRHLLTVFCIRYITTLQKTVNRPLLGAISFVHFAERL